MILRDSTDPNSIPVDSDAVAGYGDGIYFWTPEGWARFPPSTPRLVIVVSAVDAGDVLDVERGDATPADVPGWIDGFQRPGRRRATVYCDRSTIDAVRQAAASRPFDWWAATLDGTTDVPGAVAVQFRDVGPYDESLVLDPGWLEVTMTDDQIRAVVDLWFVLFTPQRWPADADRDYWVNQIRGGTPMDAALLAFLQGPAVAAKTINPALGSVPPGPAGPQGPPGPATLVPHKHTTDTGTPT